MSGDHNQYQKDKSYLDFECPRCGHCCYVDADDTSQERVDETVKQEHEPVAWANSFDLQNFDMKVRTCPDLHHTVPLYTAPPKQWVGLHGSEVPDPYKYDVMFMEGWLWAEEKLKEKNQ